MINNGLWRKISIENGQKVKKKIKKSLNLNLVATNSSNNYFSEAKVY